MPAGSDLSAGSNNHSIQSLVGIKAALNVLIILRYIMNSGMCKSAKQNIKNVASDFYGFHFSHQEENNPAKKICSYFCKPNKVYKMFDTEAKKVKQTPSKLT